MDCKAKHTKYQVPIKDWFCPECGAGKTAGTEGSFHIDDSADNVDEDCDLLHEYDELRCDECGLVMVGKNFAKKKQKIASLAPCPHCKGSGLVKKSDAPLEKQLAELQAKYELAIEYRYTPDEIAQWLRFYDGKYRELTLVEWVQNYRAKLRA